MLGPKFLDLFEKLQELIVEKEKFESSKKNLCSEIEKTKEKIKVMKANPIPKPSQTSELEKKERELILALKAFKAENETLEALKAETLGLQEKKIEAESEYELVLKNTEELTKNHHLLEKEINLLDTQLLSTQREIDLNSIKYKELLEKHKTGAQALNLKKIEIENLLQKFNEAKKTRKVNWALLKTQESGLESSFKALGSKIEEASGLLSSFVEVSSNNEKLETISWKYMEKVNENNKIREENETLKEKINRASVKNFQSKLQSFSPQKKRQARDSVNIEKCESVKLTLDKVKRLIVDINILQNKK